MDTKKTILISITLIILISFFCSCTNDSGNPLSYSPFDEMPIVTGLFFTSEESPEVLAVWGSPSGNSFCSPTIGDYTNVRYGIGETIKVKIWVVPARIPQQESSKIINLMNAHYNKLTGTGVATLVDEVKPAGNYSIDYHFTDSQDRLLPEGFYRIYVQSADWLRWCDVLNFRNESNYYKVLYNQIRNNLNYIWSP